MTEKRFAMRVVAEKMGIGYDALQARLNNRTAFSAEEIRLLIRAAPDRRLVSWLPRGTPFVVADRVESDHQISEDIEAIRTAATRIVLDAADVLAVVEQGMGDNKIDHGDAMRIRQEVEETEASLASLTVRLREYISRVAAD